MTGLDSAKRDGSALVDVRDLSKRFGEVHALEGVSFQVASGEWIAITGPSGSGKTTLINVLGGLDSPTSGHALVDRMDVAELNEAQLTRYRAQKVGFIFQQFHLVPYLTAVENVMLAQYLHSVADEAQARAALERVGLADRLDHRPSQLSGGEQQRVAVARALINQPSLILADEPTGNLDDANERIVLEIFRELHAEGHTILMVTHNPAIGDLADREIRLEHGRLASPALVAPAAPMAQNARAPETARR
jgi:putative ABC transport system ATP-binding protein